MWSLWGDTFIWTQWFDQPFSVLSNYRLWRIPHTEFWPEVMFDHIFVTFVSIWRVFWIKINMLKNWIFMISLILIFCIEIFEQVHPIRLCYTLRTCFWKPAGSIFFFYSGVGAMSCVCFPRGALRVFSYHISLERGHEAQWFWYINCHCRNNEGSKSKYQHSPIYNNSTDMLLHSILHAIYVTSYFKVTNQEFFFSLYGDM